MRSGSFKSCWLRGTILVRILIVALFSASSALAESVNYGVSADSKFLPAINRLPNDQQAAIRDAATPVFPLFIFIPGIMGSRLTKTTPEGPKLIWGRFQGLFSAPDSKLAYDPGDQVKADVMEDYFAYDSPFDVYGSAIRALKAIDLTEGDNVRKFAYDWRQSNGKSARDLAVWMCEHKGEFQNRQLVFLAHSMGGLVLKSWLKNIYKAEGCSSGEKFTDWIKIKKIFFLGTPHYGAPKAVTAFAGDYSMLVDSEDGAINAVLRNLDARTMSRSLNTYGATFPSAYELLPIVNTNKCFTEPTWRYPVSVKPLVGPAHNNIDLFVTDTWEYFNWPTVLSPGTDRVKFVKEKLPDLLRSAKEFLCDIGRFRPDQEIDTVRIVGIGRSTICSITINQPASANAPAAVKPEYCSAEDGGDGTVPRWIASEEKFLKRDKVQFPNDGHMHLVGSKDFLTYLSGYAIEIHNEMQNRFAQNVGNVDALVNMYASAHVVVPSSGRSGPNDVSRAIASRVVETLGIAPADIYTVAKSGADPVSRANAYRVFADVAPDDSPKRAWALNNTAHIYLQSRDFVAARRFGSVAVRAASQSNVLDAIRPSAGAITAAAAEQLNDGATAKLYRDFSAGVTSTAFGPGVLF